MKPDSPIHRMPDYWLDKALEEVNLSIRDDAKLTMPEFEKLLDDAEVTECPIDYSKPGDEALLFSVPDHRLREGSSVLFAVCSTYPDWELREVYGGMENRDIPEKYLHPQSGLACRIIDDGGVFRGLMEQGRPTGAPLELDKRVVAMFCDQEFSGGESHLELTINNGTDSVFTKIFISHCDGKIDASIQIGIDDGEFGTKGNQSAGARICEDLPMYIEGARLFERIYRHELAAHRLRKSIKEAAPELSGKAGVTMDA